jgi:uncharacterized protein (DUF1330 family)
MVAYVVAQIKIDDGDTYQKYIDGFLPIFGDYKGEILAADDATETLEGEWFGSRTVIIKFPDRDELLRWYKSPEYQELMQFRLQASEGNLVIAEGFE